MRFPMFLISLLLSSAACSDAKEFGRQAGIEPAATPAPADKGEALKAKPEPFVFERELTEKGGGKMTFSFTWPSEVSAEKELAAQLDQERAKFFEESRNEWEASIPDCPEGVEPCRTYSFESAYQVVANLERFLSLSIGFTSYTGGAHGIYGLDSQIWDRKRKSLIEPIAMFASQAALQEAVGTRACDALNRERAKRRDDEYDDIADDWPNNCPGLDEITLLIGSSNGKTFDRIGLYYGPYVAGPYAEGDYEITLPVDAKVLAAVKPEYANVFSVKR